MSESPKVSIVTASYEMAQFIGATIESVQAQTFPDYEHIIIDDGSTDNTREVVQRYAISDDRIRYYHQENAGQTVAKNHGLRRATGEYIAFVDSDNMWYPEKLQKQLDLFARSSPEVGVLYSDVQLINGEGEPIDTPYELKHSGRICKPLLMSNFVKFNTVLIPRRVLDDVGVFDEDLSMGIDYDLWLRISAKYEFLHMPENLVLYRIWEGQMSHRTLKRIENGRRIIDKFIEQHGDLLSRRDINRARAQIYTGRARYYIGAGEKKMALRDIGTALRHCPSYRLAWKSLAKLAMS